MSQSKYTQTRILVLSLLLNACGEENESPSLQDRFEAVYGYTDCTEVTIGTALTQPIWIRVFHTYHGGSLSQKETTFLDQNCKTSFTSVNRWAEYQILGSSDQETGEIHLEIKTRRILAYTNENAPPEMSGIPQVGCNIEMIDDVENDKCKPYFGVKRYVTLNLTPQGVRPFKDIDSAGTTEETRSIELAPYTLGILDPID